MGIVGKAASKTFQSAKSTAQKYPRSASALGGYAVGKQVQANQQRKEVRRHMKMMSATQAKYRARDKHPYSGNYYG